MFIPDCTHTFSFVFACRLKTKRSLNLCFNRFAA